MDTEKIKHIKFDHSLENNKLNISINDLAELEALEDLQLLKDDQKIRLDDFRAEWKNFKRKTSKTIKPKMDLIRNALKPDELGFESIASAIKKYNFPDTSTIPEFRESVKNNNPEPILRLFRKELDSINERRAGLFPDAIYLEVRISEVEKWWDDLATGTSIIFRSHKKLLNDIETVHKELMNAYLKLNRKRSGGRPRIEVPNSLGLEYEFWYVRLKLFFEELYPNNVQELPVNSHGVTYHKLMFRDHNTLKKILNRFWGQLKNRKILMRSQFNLVVESKHLEQLIKYDSIITIQQVVLEVLRNKHLELLENSDDTLMKKIRAIKKRYLDIPISI